MTDLLLEVGGGVCVWLASDVSCFVYDVSTTILLFNMYKIDVEFF